MNSDGIETSLIKGSTSGTQLKVSHKSFSKSQATPFSAWCIVSTGLLSGKFSIIANNVEAPRIPRVSSSGSLGFDKWCVCLLGSGITLFSLCE